MPWDASPAPAVTLLSPSGMPGNVCWPRWEARRRETGALVTFLFFQEEGPKRRMFVYLQEMGCAREYGTLGPVGLVLIGSQGGWSVHRAPGLEVSGRDFG